jgi:geranylgeranyl pyrophosphate synthase
VNASLGGLLACSSRQPDRVFEATQYAVLGGGHRWRPVLLLQTGMIHGRQQSELVAAASAIEFLHCAGIILDDMPCMDNAPVRRGKPACHVVFGEATTVLASLHLTMLALSILDAYPAPLQLAAMARETVCQMITGEAADLHAYNGTGSSAPAEQSLAETYAAKTGALFRLAVGVGACIGGASAEEREVLDAFAHDLGLAYQFLDDVSDADGTAEAHGKPAGQDRGKLSAVTIYGLQQARREAAARLKQACERLRGLPRAEGLMSTAAMVCHGETVMR